MSKPALVEFRSRVGAALIGTTDHGRGRGGGVERAVVDRHGDRPVRGVGRGRGVVVRDRAQHRRVVGLRGGAGEGEDPGRGVVGGADDRSGQRPRRSRATRRVAVGTVGERAPSPRPGWRRRRRLTAAFGAISTADRCGRSDSTNVGLEFVPPVPGAVQVDDRGVVDAGDGDRDRARWRCRPCRRSCVNVKLSGPQ